MYWYEPAYGTNGLFTFVRTSCNLFSHFILNTALSDQSFFVMVSFFFNLSSLVCSLLHVTARLVKI